jgi:RNA polymerase sigma factor (sigma-70 family)
MGDSPATRPSLLFRMRDPRDGQAWAQFVDVYAPLVYGFGRSQGLQDADAADLMQEVLRAVSAAVGRFDYNPEQGSFRGWLFTVARSKLSNFRTARARQPQGTGDTNVRHVLEEQPERGHDSQKSWDQEYDRQLFNQAAALVRQGVQDSTWQAFWQTAVEGKNAKQVADELKMTIASVYLAKSRVMARLKEQVQQLAGG